MYELISMERGTSSSSSSSAVISKPKILPVVLLSSIPLKLLKNERIGKVNIRQNHRTQPYSTDNQRSLNERTSCSNCNKQTNNQSSSTSIADENRGTSLSSSIQTVSSMIQSPMLILPIVTATTSNKSASSQAKIRSNVYCNHQQQLLHQQPVFFASSTAAIAKKKANESNGCYNSSSNVLCRVREIPCSFKYTNYNFFSSSSSLFLLLYSLICHYTLWCLHRVISSFFIHFPRNEFLCRNINTKAKKESFLRRE